MRGQKSGRGYFIRLIVGLIVAMICSFTTGSVSGQGGQFTTEADHAFGQKIVFSLTAVTDLELKQAILFFRQAGQVEPPQKTIVPLIPAENDPHHLQAEFVLDPHSEEVNIAPFAEVAYWWELESVAGQTILVPSESIVYDDNRFAWRFVKTDPFTFYWTGEGREIPEAAISVLETIWPDMQLILPVTFGEPVPVYIYPSSSDLRAALNLTNHEQRQGHTNPALGVVLVTAVNSRTAEAELSQQLPHVFTHQLLYHSAGADNYHQLPYWFNEGLALFFTEGDGTRDDLVAAAVASQSTLPLLELCKPEQPAPQLELGQAQAASLVKFVHERYGDRALTDLADAFSQGQDCATAVETSLGQSLAGLENAWLQHQQQRSGLLQFVSRNGLWLLLILASFIIMGLLIWQPRRR